MSEDAARLTLLTVTASVMFLAMLLSVLLERSGHIRLRHWSENAGERLRQLYGKRRRFEAFRFLIAILARLLPVVFLGVAWWHAGMAEWRPALVLLALIAGLEIWSRFLVRQHAERVLLLLSPAYGAIYWLFWPLVVLLSPLFGGEGENPPRSQSDEEEDDEASDGEIDAFIDVGRREGILEPEEEALVRSVVDFGDTYVRSIMTPRVEINSAPADADGEALAAKFFASKNSRLPIYRDSIDHVEGILHIRDLFQTMHEGRQVDLLELCQKPLYVPENKPLPDLLTELQKLHQQMAIVVDEYGGVAGLVTVEDLIEEIVGDIRDEHEDQAETETLGDGGWRLAGRIHLEDFEDLAGLDLDAAELPYETLSGLICGELGYVPKAGERLDWRGLEMLVEEADERRVVRVSVKPPATQEAQNGAASAS